jgi:hypothetical protein
MEQAPVNRFSPTDRDTERLKRLAELLARPEILEFYAEAIGQPLPKDWRNPKK